MRRLAQLAFALAASLLPLVLAGCAAQKAVIPKSYHHFISADQTFTCDSPDGWTATSTTAQAVEAHASFKSGDAAIHVDSDTASSVTADLQTAQNNQAQNAASEMGQTAPAAQKPPIEAVHEQEMGELAGNLNRYQEVTTSVMPTRFGDGRLTEYTGENNGKVHGYFLTALSKDRTFTVRCQCPEPEWPALQSAFQHVVNSLTPGQS